MAVLAFGALGAGIGGVIGGGAGALTGFNIGATLGGVLFPKQLDSSHLNDLHVSSSSYGTVVPYVWGYAKVPGQVFWAATDANGNHLVEHTSSTRKGGSGGAEIEETTASATFAVAVCKGQGREIDGTVISFAPEIKRIWFDDEIVFEYTNAEDDSKVYPIQHLGTQTTADSIIEANVFARHAEHAPAYIDLCYLVFSDVNLARYGNRIPNIMVEVYSPRNTKRDLIRDILDMSGYDRDNLNIDNMSNSTITGYSITSDTLFTEVLGHITQTYFIDFVELGSTIYAVDRTATSDIALTTDDIGWTSSTDPVKSLYRLSRKKYDETPNRIELGYICFPETANNNKYYESSQQLSTYQTNTVYGNKNLSIPFVLTDEVASKLANTIMDMEVLEQESIEFDVSYAHYKLMPTSVFTITLENVAKKYTVTSVDVGLFQQIRITAKTNSASALVNIASQVANNAGNSVNNSKILALQFVAFSGRELMIEDQRDAGFYVSCAKAYGETAPFTGGAVYYSLDGGTNYTYAGVLGKTGIFGTATGTLGGGYSAWDYDEVSSVLLTESTDGTIASTTQAKAFAGANACIIGNEVVTFDTVSGTAPAFTVTKIYRGVRDTIPTHSFPEGFLMVNNEALLRVSVPTTSIGATVKIKVLSQGQALGVVTAINVTIATPSGAELNASTDITTGTLPITRGGTGLGAIGGAEKYIKVDSTGTVLEYITINNESNIAALIQKLMTLREDANVVVISDSTGNGTNRFIHQLFGLVAPLWTKHNVDYYQWSSTDYPTYANREVLQNANPWRSAKSITLLTRTSAVAYATTSASHGYSTGDKVTVAGATEIDYNGTFTVTVTSVTEFNYAVANSPTTPSTGTRTCGINPILNIYNCAVSGKTTAYAMGDKWTNAVASKRADLVIINHGHNQGTYTTNNDSFRQSVEGAMRNLVEMLRIYVPDAGIIANIQNPTGNNVGQQIRATVYYSLFNRLGVGSVDTMSAFLDSTGEVDTALLNVDLVHPTTAGSLVQANKWLPLFYPRSAFESSSLLDPSSTSVGKTLITDPYLINGLLTQSIANVTVDRSTRKVDGNAISSIRLAPTGTTQASVVINSVTPVAKLAGKWVTAWIREFLPAGIYTSSGRIAIADGSGNTVVSDAPSAEATDGWINHGVSFQVATTGATYLRLTIYAGILTAVTGITQAAGLATVTLVAHGRTTGDVITISGSTILGYNLTAQITVTDADHFTYACSSGLATPATGTLYYQMAETNTISSMTRSSTTATVTTAQPHGLNSGNTVQILGTTETEYNGSFVVTVTSTTVFTFTVDVGASTPATGTPLIVNPLAMYVQEIHWVEGRDPKLSLPRTSTVVPSANTVAVSMIPAYDFDGTTGSGIAPYNVIYSFGTSNFGIAMMVTLRTLLLATELPLVNCFTSNTGWKLALTTTGLLRFYLGDTSTGFTSYTSTAPISTITGVGVPIYIVVPVTRAGLLYFYVNGQQLGSALDISAQSANTVSNASIALQIGVDGAVFASMLVSCVALFNGVIDTTYFGAHGVNLISKWGGRVAYQSDFSAGINSWVNTAMTLTGNQDTISDGSNSYDNCLKALVTTAAGTHLAGRYNDLTAGKTYRLSITYLINASASDLIGFRFYSQTGSSLSSLLADLTVVGTWTTYTVDFVNATASVLTNTGLQLRALKTGSTLTWVLNDADATDYVHIANLTITEIGAVVAYEGIPTAMMGTAWVQGNPSVAGADMVMSTGAVPNFPTTRRDLQVLSANTTLDRTYETVLVDTSGGTKTITMPLASSSYGMRVYLKRVGANAVTIARSGSDTFFDTSSVTTLSLATDGAKFTLEADATNSRWVVVGASTVNLTSEVTGILPVANGGTNATAFTAGSIVFAGNSGTYTEDNANFFWDNTNNRLGIGITSPVRMIDVYNAGAVADIRLRSGAGNCSFYIDSVAGNVSRFRFVTSQLFAIRDETAGIDRLFIQNSGNIGIGTGSTVSNRLHVIDTATQARFGYDTSNYLTIDVSSAGVVTFDAVGASAGFTFSDSVTIADAKNIILNTTTGTKLGTGTTQKLGFWNVTPIVQPASANQAASATTGATNIAPYGFTTAAQADAIITQLNQMRTDLIALGLIKGSA